MEEIKQNTKKDITKKGVYLEVPLPLYDRIKFFAKMRGLTMRGVFMSAVNEYLLKYSKDDKKIESGRDTEAEASPETSRLSERHDSHK